MAKNTKFEPKDSQKRKALSPHVFNEIDQFVWMLSTPIPDPFFWRNAQVESIALHARCLMDFFNGTVERSEEHDDVWAHDYTFDKKYTDRTISERANKDIAHLTYSRIERYPERSAWKTDDLRPLLVLCEEFVVHLFRTGVIAANGDDSAPWIDLQTRLKSLNRIVDTPNR